MAFTEALCPILQDSLNAVAQQNASLLTRQQTGFSDFLMSAENRQGFQQISVSNRNGGTRAIQIVYLRPTSNDQVVNSKPDVCTAPTRENAPKEDLIDPSTMSRRYTSALELSEEQIAQLCEWDSDEFRAQTIMAEMNALVTSVNRDLLTQQIAQFGQPIATTAPGPYTYVPPIAAATARLFKEKDGVPSANFAGWSTDVKNVLRRSRMAGRPMVVGAGDEGIALYADLLDIACCNDHGIDLSQASREMAFFYDQDADLIWGNNEFGVFMPGSLQLITHNEYGDNDMGTPNPRRGTVAGKYEKDVIVDPFSGMTFDFKLVYDECAEVYKLTIGLIYKLWALPAESYLNTDPMYGVRNTLRFVADTVSAP